MTAKPRLLISIPFWIFPPMSGGGLRGCYLLRELARRFRTTAFVRDSPDTLRAWVAGELGTACDLQIFRIPDYQRPTSLLTKVAHRFQTLVRTGDPFKPTDAVQHELHRLTETYLLEHSPDIVVATNLESWPLLLRIRKKHPRLLTVLDLHNIESELLQRDLKARGLEAGTDSRVRRLRREERRLEHCAHLALTCSEDDRRQLLAGTDTSLKIAVIPNGVAIEKSPFDPSPDKEQLPRVLFCGTLNYWPNIQGLNWFLDSVWPLVTAKDPSARLQVVGRGYEPENFPSVRQLNTVEIVGEVPEVGPHYRSSSVAVCPLLSGSGTRLKILEAMSFGNPTVSTSIGCEGLAVRDSHDILIRDDAQAFADAILTLRRKSELFNQIRNQALQTVHRNYDWQSIGSMLEHALKTKLAEHRGTTKILARRA